MRNNQPVSQREYHLPEGATLMSVTDAVGTIRHANAAFVAASGFAREALVGQPHNLVRHPDMPPAAFADMWRTLKGGESWSALVKNRRANGDHYWVRANATPLRRGGRLVGYLSVRTRPERAEVAAAEALHARLRSPGGSGWALHKGVPVRTGWRAPLTWGRRLPLRGRLAIAVALAAALPALAAAGAGLGAGASAPWGALAWVGGASVAGALLATAWLERQVARPIRALLGQAQAVATGDRVRPVLAGRVDELGMLARAVNQAGLNLQALMEDVGQQVAGLRVAAAEIADGNQDLSGRTVATASSLEQTAAAIEQLQVTVAQSADIAREASSLATDASRSASDGGGLVTGVAGTIGEIHEGARRIGELIGEIDAIAFQTSILALNASVESARAGESGRGFAVVAAEVRGLAQRSAEAARQIGRLVRGSLKRVDAGQAQVAAAAAAMAGIVDQAARVDRLLEVIHRAVAEQAAGMDQVTVAVSQIDQGTQQNAALVEQSAAAAQRIRQRADELAAAVRVFEAPA